MGTVVYSGIKLSAASIQTTAVQFCKPLMADLLFAVQLNLMVQVKVMYG
jgi:hypothetical protein